MKPIDAASIGRALDLNNRHAAELSFQTAQGFQEIVATAFYAKWSTGEKGFLIAFDETAPYGSPNFLWFRERYPKFVYVDRIVIDPPQRGRGAARRLYEDLVAAALAHGRPLIVCEVNITPPNPASDAFHERLGFKTVGSATLPGGDKVVRCLAKELAM
jgi:predicted GNAT superfamily acetyltransferase